MRLVQYADGNVDAHSPTALPSLRRVPFLFWHTSVKHVSGCHRLKEAHGSLSSVLLYVAFFLPTSINTAWLSCAAAMAALMVPQALHYTAHLEGIAIVLLVGVTILGKAPFSWGATNMQVQGRCVLTTNLCVIESN